MSWENVVGSIGGLAGSVGGLVEGAQQNKLNREVFEYNKNLDVQKMAREDNAVQRRAADLEAAGLSKTLAAGSPASSNAGDHLNAPHMTQFEKFNQGLEIGQKMTELLGQGEQANLLKQQAEGVRLENLIKQANLPKIEIEREMNQLELDYMKEHTARMPMDPAFWHAVTDTIAEVLGHSAIGSDNEPTVSEEEAKETGKAETNLGFYGPRYFYANTDKLNRQGLNLSGTTLANAYNMIDAGIYNKLRENFDAFDPYNTFPKARHKITEAYGPRSTPKEDVFSRVGYGLYRNLNPWATLAPGFLSAPDIKNGVSVFFKNTWDWLKKKLHLK